MRDQIEKAISKLVETEPDINLYGPVRAEPKSWTPGDRVLAMYFEKWRPARIVEVDPWQQSIKVTFLHDDGSDGLTWSVNKRWIKPLPVDLLGDEEFFQLESEELPINIFGPPTEPEGERPVNTGGGLQVYRLVVGDMQNGPWGYLDYADENLYTVLGPQATYDDDTLGDERAAKVGNCNPPAVILEYDRDLWLVVGTEDVDAAVDLVNTNPPYEDLA